MLTYHGGYYAYTYDVTDRVVNSEILRRARSIFVNLINRLFTSKYHCQFLYVMHLLARHENERMFIRQYM